MVWKQALVVGGYFLWFMLCAIALVVWQKKTKRRRNPFPDQTRLLRTPGETQLRLINKHDEDLFLWVVLAAGVPVLLAAALLTLTGLLPAALRLPGVIVSAIALITSFVACLRWFVERTRERGDRYLGYYGERMVAEQLDGLKRLGWQVFHDIPCDSNGRKFNIDHLTVGPQGIFLIETKTRRKGGAQKGFDDYKVYYDGRDLAWPWGRDNHGLEQAERNSAWIASYLGDSVTMNLNVIPILALPGWWVELKPGSELRRCKVFNPKGLSKYLSNGPTLFDGAQIAAISGKLEYLCRDVEY